MRFRLEIVDLELLEPIVSEYSSPSCGQVDDRMTRFKIVACFSCGPVAASPKSFV